MTKKIDPLLELFYKYAERPPPSWEEQKRKEEKQWQTLQRALFKQARANSLRFSVQSISFLLGLRERWGDDTDITKLVDSCLDGEYEWLRKIGNRKEI